MPPGTYKARWDKGHLKVLFEKDSKPKETTFVVLSSAAIPTGKAARSEEVSNGGKTVLKISSTPLGADIGLDGSFVGQTPSSVLALPGEHYIKILKTGYKPWERTIRTSGGEVTVFCELDPQEEIARRSNRVWVRTLSMRVTAIFRQLRSSFRGADHPGVGPSITASVSWDRRAHPRRGWAQRLNITNTP